MRHPSISTSGGAAYMNINRWVWAGLDTCHTVFVTFQPHFVVRSTRGVSCGRSCGPGQTFPRVLWIIGTMAPLDLERPMYRATSSCFQCDKHHQHNSPLMDRRRGKTTPPPNHLPSDQLDKTPTQPLPQVMDPLSCRVGEKLYSSKEIELHGSLGEGLGC